MDAPSQMIPSAFRVGLLASLCLASLGTGTAHAVTNVFFTGSQTATMTASNLTAVTLRSGDYLFTYSQDGYWSASPGGPPTGRFFTVFWPTGVQAQATTAGPTVGTGANITLKRADGKLFDLWSFTGKILLNTAGAGGAFEIMPQLNGEDAFADPRMYDCTGYYGMSFPYTPTLTNYDTYKIHMWGDFALTALTLIDTNPIVPVSTATNTITASVSPVGAGTFGGAGAYSSNSVCTLTASANPGWGFKNWTQNGTQVSTSAAYTFTVRSNRALVANFVPAYTVTTTVTPSYGGSATGGGTFNSNSTVTVHAVAASGFPFVNWTDYDTPVSTATNYSFTITGDHSLTANFALLPQTAIFDFDTGYPTVAPGQGMPGSQSNRLLAAYFSTIAGGWSMQTRQSSVIGAPPSFAGNFLYPSTWWSSFQIQFSEPITNLAFDFMTGDVSSEFNTASTVRITAYTNSTATPPIGAGTAQGTWANGAYPDGHINYCSTTPFTIVQIDIAPVGVVSGLLFVDNLVAQRAAPQSFTITTTTAPTNGGFVFGAGNYASGAMATLTATANFGFVFSEWTENGAPVSTLPSYRLTVTTNRAFVANFIPNTPPVALGGTFFQLANTPLAISIADLVAFDYDPDGQPVYFTGVSATTTHGLILTTNATQILVPLNSIADGFTYTLSDGNGDIASGSATISIITNVTSRVLALELGSMPGSARVSFTGVPWYYYSAERGTNVVFTGVTAIWSVQAWADGSIYVWDDFSDLGSKPPEAFYRLFYTP